MEAKTDLKSLSTKAKIEYIWDYYRWHIIVTILVVTAVISTIHHYTTYRDPFLNVIMVNSIGLYDSTLDGFTEYQNTYGYDTTENPIELASGFYLPDDENALAASYTDLQALSAYIASGDQDLFFGTGKVYLNYCEQGALADLSTILSPELLAEYEDCLLYSTADGTLEPYPCAIKLTDNSWLTKYNYYDTCYFGIFYSSPNPENATEFAEFLLTYE